MFSGISHYQITKADFQLVSDVVYEHCGISLSDDKLALVQARIARQMRAGHFTSVTDYLSKVLADREGNVFIEFIDAISTNLTGFFREPAHFKYLAETIMPDLLKRKAILGSRRILAWSAACSSGEEPYSLAMTLLESMGTQAQGCEARILASDISTRMLDAARRGVYEAHRLTHIPLPYRSKYFGAMQQHAGKALFQVSPSLQSMVRCRHVNLVDSWPFNGQFDLIFCRNVLIYFDRDTQQRLLDRLCNRLSPGGFLFTGHSESLAGVNHQLLHVDSAIYRKPADPHASISSDPVRGVLK
jgi:chemotaxis protein methyltransferase CheR